MDEDKKDVELNIIGKGDDDIGIGDISSLDEAEIFLREHGVSHIQLQEMLDDPVRSKKIRRRIDLILLPLLCGTYTLQYIDKQASFHYSDDAVHPLIADRLSHTVLSLTCSMMPTLIAISTAGLPVSSSLASDLLFLSENPL